MASPYAYAHAIWRRSPLGLAPAMRPLPQLDEAAYARIAYFLDFRDMTRLRQCSKRTLAGVGMEHRASLCRIVGRFVPDPQSLCEALEERHAFVGGSCALLFFLRDVDFQPSNLDVYVPREEGERILEHLVQVQGAHRVETAQQDDFGITFDLQERHLSDIMTLHTAKGVVQVHCSRTCDALPAIARSWCSLLVNYVNPRHFGSAYPWLLFQRRGLVGEWTEEEEAHVTKYAGRGFDIRISVNFWEDLDIEGCGSNKWACATQPRMFIDAGAMRARTSPLHVRPINSTSRWRLDYRPCGGRCLADRRSGIPRRGLLLVRKWD
ncbi:hypothetical protein C8Q76DRAFT_789638 [Earliella scabrosa]|nr:hypothetical protein C8Q76DRAFT_789638 [Earliella scabrosa]